MPAKLTSKLIPVSKAHPCPVCQGDHKCSTSPDGLILCGRKDGPQDGFKHIGPCKDPAWTMYRTKGDTRTSVGSPDPRTVSAPDFPRAATRFAAALPDDRRKQLAGLLRLPDEANTFVIQFNLRLYFALRTKEASLGSEEVYTQRGMTVWHFDGSGRIANTVWTKLPGVGNGTGTAAGADQGASFAAITDGTKVPLTSAHDLANKKLANEALAGEDWS